MLTIITTFSSSIKEGNDTKASRGGSTLTTWNTTYISYLSVNCERSFHLSQKRSPRFALNICLFLTRFPKKSLKYVRFGIKSDIHFYPWLFTPWYYVRVFHKLSTIPEFQYCQLCFSCAIRNKIDEWSLEPWNVILLHYFTFTNFMSITSYVVGLCLGNLELCLIRVFHDRHRGYQHVNVIKNLWFSRKQWEIIYL